MANMNDRYMEEYEAARSGRPSIQETLTKAQEQERKKKRHRYEKIGAALLVLIGALSWYFFYYTQTPQYTVKQIQKAVQQHDAVTVHQKLIWTACFQRAPTPSAMPSGSSIQTANSRKKTSPNSSST